MTLNRKVLWQALIASFSVYLLPLVTVHLTLVWGWAIGAEIFTSESDREPLWLAADLGLAVALQAGAFVLFAWIFSGRGWRWLVLAPAVPVFGVVLNFAYFFVLPSYFLIEAQSAQEVGDWPVACRVEDATLLQVRAPATPDLARAQEAWTGPLPPPCHQAGSATPTLAGGVLRAAHPAGRAGSGRLGALRQASCRRR